VPPRRLSTALALVLLPGFAAVAADDPYGDPVPAGAKARLGTARLRNTGGANFNAVTPDGKFLVGTGFGTGLIFVDPATGKTARTVKVEGDFGTVQGLSADGKRAAGSGFGSATVIDTDAGKKLAQVKRQVPSGENGVSLSADGKRLAVGGVRGFDAKDKDRAVTAVVWDVDAGKELAAVAPAQNETVFVNLSADGKRLVTWGYHYDRTAKEPPRPENDPSRLMQVWEAGTGKEIAKARMPTGYTVTAVALSPDGSLVAASGGDGSVRLFDAATGAEKGQLLGRTRQGQRLAFAPDGKTLAAGGADGSVQRWSVADGVRLGTTEPPFPLTYSPRAIVFTGNDRAVAWVYRGAALAVWEVPSGKLLTPAGGHSSSVVSAAAAGGGREILTAASDGVVLRWDPTTGKELGAIPLRIPGGGFGAGLVGGPVTLSADGTRALASDGSGGLGVFDLPAGSQPFAIPGDSGREARGGFSADGTKVIQVLTSFDPKNVPRVAVWDVASGKKLAEVQLPGLTQVGAGLSPDGKSLVTVGVRQDDKKGGPGTFVVAGWEAGTNNKRGEFTEPAGFATVYAPAVIDGKTAVVTSPRSGPIVVDYVAGTKVRDLASGGLRMAAAPALSPDRKTLAVPLFPPFGPNQTSSVVLIDVDAGKEKRKLEGLSGTPTAVAFLPDGKTLVTGSSDTTALVWDLDGK
jgi:WD40 repeat protein